MGRDDEPEDDRDGRLHRTSKDLEKHRISAADEQEDVVEYHAGERDREESDYPPEGGFAEDVPEEKGQIPAAVPPMMANRRLPV